MQAYFAFAFFALPPIDQLSKDQGGSTMITS
jgi:hypothetical protein